MRVYEIEAHFVQNRPARARFLLARAAGRWWDDVASSATRILSLRDEGGTVLFILKDNLNRNFDERFLKIPWGLAFATPRP